MLETEFVREQWTVEFQIESRLSRPTSIMYGRQPVQLTLLGHQCSCGHHLAHIDGALQRIHAATRVGGLIVIAQFTDPLRFLPDDLGFGEPGLESRCIDIFKRERFRSLPAFGLEWGRRLERAGFSAVEERLFHLEGGDVIRTRCCAHMPGSGLNAPVRQRSPLLSSDDLSVLRSFSQTEGHTCSRNASASRSMPRFRVVVRAAKW